MRCRALAALLLVALAAAPAALADGDPASDYLLGQSTFLSPFDGHIPSSSSNELIALLASAKQQGFPLKVAVIVTAYDLGAVPILFDKPKLYAKFLGEEDYYYWRDELVVVMPNGYGIFKAKNLPVADRAVIAKLPAIHTSNGAALVAAAESAVRELAARRGITLSAVSASAGGSSTTRDRLEIGGAVLLAALLALGARVAWRRRRPPGTISP
ncbi:MAG TPA: hypothetical protein VMV08_09320 [Gaiellaceae bacterium]|nr:hypothetical protein [Gaiellaceae bacterium]